MYGNQNNATRIFQIHREITNLHQVNKPFVQLLGNLKSLWNELEIYHPHICDVVITGGGMAKAKVGFSLGQDFINIFLTSFM